MFFYFHVMKHEPSGEPSCSRSAGDDQHEVGRVAATGCYSGRPPDFLFLLLSPGEFPGLEIQAVQFLLQPERVLRLTLAVESGRGRDGFAEDHDHARKGQGQGEIVPVGAYDKSRKAEADGQHRPA